MYLVNSVFISVHTQSLFCSSDAGLHSPELQGFQLDCVPTLHHPSSLASPSHDGQNPTQGKYSQSSETVGDILGTKISAVTNVLP